MHMKIWSLFLVLVLALSGFNAEAAKRMGSGKSFGKQSNNVTQRDAAPASPGQGMSNAAPKQAPGAPAAAAKRPWGAMLGGLAAGLGLAWLASSLGLGEGMGQMIMYLLMAMLVAMAVAWFIRSRKAASNPTPKSPFAFQGAGAATSAPAYRLDNVGNDASARPWERNQTAFDTTATSGAGSAIGSGLMGSQSWGVPAGFDTEGFIRAAKTNFVTLQAAWDKSDISALRAMMTDDMLSEIKAQLAEREKQSGTSLNTTDVVMLDATLLGIEELATEYMASVEFSGMVREEPSASPSPFREVWNMTKSKSAGGGWLVAGVQALQ